MTIKETTKSQGEAVKNLYEIVEKHGELYNDKGFSIVKFDVQGTDYGDVWVTIDTDLLGLERNNALRVMHGVSGNHWFASVTPRGKVTLYSGPKSLEQFAGQRWGIAGQRDVNIDAGYFG